MHGLIKRDLDYIRQAHQRLPEIDQILLFGSRAIGNYKPGSDVDLAIVGAQVTYQTISKLDELLNEVYPLPYQFDLLHYNTLSNDNLKQHIDQFGRKLT